MIEKKQVLHSDGTLEPFKPRLIEEQLLRETDIPKEIITEETMKKMREERKIEIKNWNNALSIATDIYHSVIENELNLDSVMFNNNGLKTIDNLTYYSITLTDEDDNLLKEIGINFENNTQDYLSILMIMEQLKSEVHRHDYLHHTIPRFQV